jgi:hypothetical protein
MMARYSAVYRCSKTGRVCMMIERANNYFHASRKLPRWIYSDGLKMRRQGGPQIYEADKQ